MLYNDRLKRALFALFRASTPRLDYYALYRAKVVSQDPQNPELIDVQPEDDARIPPMGGVPLRLGIPGASVVVKPGAHVLIGWSDGNPAKPYVALFDTDDPAVSITVVAKRIVLGGKTVEDGGDLVANLDGVVHGRGIDPFTGAPYSALGNTSKVVIAKKEN